MPPKKDLKFCFTWIMQIHQVRWLWSQHSSNIWYRYTCIYLLPKLHRGTWSMCSWTKKQLDTYSMADYHYAACLYDAFSHDRVLYCHIHTFLLVGALMLRQNTKQRAQLQPPLVLWNSMPRNENSYNWTAVSVPKHVQVYQTTRWKTCPYAFTASV
jgi:hypothetical protein